MLASSAFPARLLASVLFAILATSRAAHAQEAAASPPAVEPRPLELDWQGPSDCAEGDAVRSKVLRLLGSSQRALGAPIKVSVTVRHEKGSRYVAELTTSTASGGGTKRLEGESCDAIALATAVVIALSVDPNASLDAEPAPEAPAAPPPAPPLGKRKPKRKPSVPRPKPAGPKREISPYLHGSIGVLFKLLDQPSAFSAAGIGVRYHRFSVELGGAVYQSRDVARTDRPKVGAELRLTTGELLACYAALPFTLGAVELCPGARLEYLSATAFGVSNPDQAGVLLGSGVGVVRGRLRATSWLSATLDLGASARPFHPRFVLLGVGDVYDIPWFSPLARTGLVVEF